MPDELEALLSRSIAERLREHKYRFAQSAVFGLPVVVLQLFGGRLGGLSSGIWVGLIQTLLGGWVVYVAAAGMFFEGFLLLRRGKVIADGVVALIVIATLRDGGGHLGSHELRGVGVDGLGGFDLCGLDRSACWWWLSRRPDRGMLFRRQRALSASAATLNRSGPVSPWRVPGDLQVRLER